MYFLYSCKEMYQRNTPRKSLISPSAPVFREAQNSRNRVPFRQPALLVPKNPHERGAFQRGSIQTINTPGTTILLPDSNDDKYKFGFPYSHKVKNVVARNT